MGSRRRERSSPPMQQLAKEYASEQMGRLMLRLSLAPAALVALRLRPSSDTSAPKSLRSKSIATQRIESVTGTSVDHSQKMFHMAGNDWPMPVLHLIEDRTDTWSHDIDRYPAE